MDTKVAKNIQTYIELVYSEKSELNSIQNLDERKKTACEKAKLNPNDEYVQSIINMKDMIVNEQIFEYLRQQNGNDFVLLISDQHLFWELQQRQMKRLVDDDSDSTLKDLELKTKISEKSEQLLERIEVRKRKIFSGNEEEKMATTKIRIMTPEQRLRTKKLV